MTVFCDVKAKDKVSEPRQGLRQHRLFPRRPCGQADTRWQWAPKTRGHHERPWPGTGLSRRTDAQAWSEDSLGGRPFTSSTGIPGLCLEWEEKHSKPVKVQANSHSSLLYHSRILFLSAKSFFFQVVFLTVRDRSARKVSVLHNSTVLATTPFYVFLLFSYGLGQQIPCFKHLRLSSKFFCCNYFDWTGQIKLTFLSVELILKWQVNNEKLGIDMKIRYLRHEYLD